MKKFLTVLASSLLLLWACTENPVKEKKVWPYKFTYLKGDVVVNDKPVTIDVTLQESDTVVTKRGAYATISFGDASTLTLKPNSKVYLNLIASDKTEIFQESGKTFSQVQKGKQYTIKTPTVVAGVRGTSFELSSSEQSTTIHLLDGKVEATTVNQKVEQKVVIESGQKLAAVRGKPMKPVEMTDKELTSLKVVSAFVSAPKNSVSAVKEAEQVIEKIENNDHPPVVKPAKKAMTLEQIKKVYGRIAKITTKSGQEFTGYFSQKGNFMQIVTPNGTVVIDVNRVAKVVPIP